MCLWSPHCRKMALCRVLGALPSVFLSGTRQRSLWWSSVALGKVLSVTTAFFESRNLGTGKTLGKDRFTERQALDERRSSAKDRQQPSIADGRYLCRVPGVDTRQRRYFAECRSRRHSARRHSAKHVLSSALPRHSAKYISIFSFYSQTFCGLFLHYVDLHVLFLA
jgi:hypothetical protein